MKHVSGAWLPDDESDQVMLMAGARYQEHKLKAAMRYVKNYNLAVDVGAHCGLWSMQLEKLFSRVVAFEPLERHLECYRKNTNGKCELYEVAIGETSGECSLKIVYGLSGQSHILQTDGTTPMRTLDSYGFDGVDLLKIDTEGYELFVLKGAQALLKDQSPVIIVEQKPGHGKKYGLKDTEALAFLEGIGYRQKKEIVGDYIMVRE